jgi:uncharacterized protein DUF2721
VQEHRRQALNVDQGSRIIRLRINRIRDASFIAAMASFIGAILCFLREVFIATSTLRIGLHRHR